MTRAGEPRRSLDGALALLVAGALALSVVTYLRLPLTRPSPEDYRRAAAHVRAGFAPGDLVDLNPSWATRARELLGDLPLQQYRRIDLEDLGRHRRVWLVSLFGAERREAVRRGLDERARLVEARRFGRIDVRLYALLDAPRVLFDFREELGRARAWTERGGERVPCGRWTGQGWQCAEEPWNSVARTILELGGEPRTVIWAPPVEHGTKTVEWADVPLGSRLLVAGGFRTRWARPELAPALLEVLVDGERVAGWEYPSAPGFPRHELDTSRWAGGRHRVSFRVATARQLERQFAFSAEVRE